MFGRCVSSTLAQLIEDEDEDQDWDEDDSSSTSSDAEAEGMSCGNNVGSLINPPRFGAIF